MKENISKILFIVLFAASFFMPTALSLIAGILIAVTLGAPFKKFTKKTSKYLLQLSVIGLGFGMNLYSAVETGKDGMLFTIISVIGVMCLGVVLGKAFRLSRNNSYLISSGTAIATFTQIRYGELSNFHLILPLNISMMIIHLSSRLWWTEWKQKQSRFHWRP